MLNYALVFVLIALMAAVVGFSGIAIASTLAAKLLFFTFLVAFILTIALGAARRT
jgi:uncharacterized membrane protein YtjA (UPF0391 family)